MDEKGRDLLLAKERYSVRKYKSDMIGDDELNRILEAGMLAPTGCNYQPQRIYVLKSDEAIAKIRSLSRCAFDAPVVLMTLGYPAGDSKALNLHYESKDMNEIIRML